MAIVPKVARRTQILKPEKGKLLKDMIDRRGYDHTKGRPSRYWGGTKNPFAGTTTTKTP